MAAPNPNPNNEDSPPQYTGHPFFDFLQSMEDNAGASNRAGVDHRAGPQFGGFPFGAPFFAGYGGGPGGWGGRAGRAGRCRRGDRQRGWWGPMNPPTGDHEGVPFEGYTSDAPAAEGSSSRDAHVDEKKKDNDEKDGSPDTMRDAEDDGAEGCAGPSRPEGAGRCGHVHGRSEHGNGHGPCRRGGRGWRGGFWGPPPFGPHGPHGPHSPPPPPMPFDAQSIQALIQPYADMAREFAQQFRANATATGNGAGHDTNVDSTTNADASDAFSPPVDVFDTEHAYILHVALPGAKKDDVGVNWDGDKGELSIAGVVHRPGDEAFLQTMVSSERRAGLFERVVRIPPRGRDRDEVDGLGISAKLEDGVLVVTVPKVEKEWTEVHKIEID